MMTRTTIRIPQALLEELKREALRKGRSLAAEIQDVLLRGMRNPKDSNETPTLITSRAKGGVRQGIDERSTSNLLEASESDVAA